MSQEAVTVQEVVISPVAVVKAVGKLTSQSITAGSVYMDYHTTVIANALLIDSLSYFSYPAADETTQFCS